MVVFRSPGSWCCWSYARFHGACRCPSYAGLQVLRPSLHLVINVNHHCLLCIVVIDAGISIQYNMISYFCFYITMLPSTFVLSISASMCLVGHCLCFSLRSCFVRRLANNAYCCWWSSCEESMHLPYIISYESIRFHCSLQESGSIITGIHIFYRYVLDSTGIYRITLTSMVNSAHMIWWTQLLWCADFLA